MRTDIDTAALARWLDGNYAGPREEARALLRDPATAAARETREEYRTQVLAGLKFLGDKGFGARAASPVGGGHGDAAGAIAQFQTLAFGDLSLLVKTGVQFGLFCGAIDRLGSDRHRRTYLPAAITPRHPAVSR